MELVAARRTSTAGQDGPLETFDELLQRARAVINTRELSKDASCGTVGAALEIASGDVLVRVCIDTARSMAFCAEHAAAAAMVAAGQNEVRRMVAVSRRGPIFLPADDAVSSSLNSH